MRNIHAGLEVILACKALGYCVLMWLIFLSVSCYVSLTNK